MNPFAKHIANALSISEHQVEATLKLLDEGCTIPFIARYRKERTGNLDEVQITRISELNAQLKELEKRKATILKTIAEQGTTVLLVEQNVKQALKLSKRTYVLENGTIAMEGSSEELISNPHVQKAYLGL